MCWERSLEPLNLCLQPSSCITKLPQFWSILLQYKPQHCHRTIYTHLFKLKCGHIFKNAPGFVVVLFSFHHMPVLDVCKDNVWFVSLIHVSWCHHQEVGRMVMVCDTSQRLPSTRPQLHNRSPSSKISLWFALYDMEPKNISDVTFWCN